MAVDFFLKLDGVDGESKDKAHAGEIDVLSWSFGASQSGGFGFGGGGGAGKVNLQDFSFTMKANKATPALFLACATGDHIGSAILTCRKAGGEQQEFMIFTMTDVLVTSYQTGGSSEEPIESVSLNYAQIEVAYYPQKDDGTLDSMIKTGWNQETNVKV